MLHDPLTKDSLFQPLPEKRAFKEIANQIRNLIYSRTLKPGDKLPSERELAIQFKAGRISVREALRMLEQAGLILIKQGSVGGAYIKAVDMSVATDSMSDLLWLGDIRLEDLTEARLAVEKLILRIAFDKITESEMEMLGKCIKDLETAIRESARGDFPFDNVTLTKFHLVLVQATKNPVFEIILKVLMDVTIKVINRHALSVEHLKKHVSFHNAIYKALKKRDLVRAMQKMEEHMLDVKNHYSEKKDKSKY